MPISRFSSSLLSYPRKFGVFSGRDSSYGRVADNPGLSAVDIKNVTGTTTDGIYYINLPVVGSTPVYCIMNPTYSGGGWMMTMKATRGTTFNYASTYWTAINTLNPTDTTRNDADAKFNTFNYYQATDILAVWPDMANGGSIAASTMGWTWLETAYAGSGKTLQTFFSTQGQTSPRAYSAFSGWGSPFSNQTGATFYGYNFTSNGTSRVRWGFGWNNEADFASNDVSGGIGMDSGKGNYSAGDYIGCCQVQTGVNRSARVEMYVR